MTSSRSQISISSSSLVGGLVGKNDGNISNSLALGRVLFTTVSSLPSANFSATVGQSSGTINNLYFLEKNLGTQKMINPTVTNCVAGIVTYTSSVFLNPDSPDLYFSSSNGFYNGNSLMTLSSVVPTSAFAMNVGDCGFGQNFSFVKSFGPPGMSAASFSIPSNFTAFNMAYPGHLEENVLEYHKADMYKREPTMDLPIWVLEEGDAYPRLLQVED